MNALRLSQIDRLRARDGVNCWWCFSPIDFRALPNTKKAPTLEHRTPLSLGGTGRLDNLLLCHPGCNRQLKDWPREKKDKARARKRAKWKAAAEVPALPVVTQLPKNARYVASLQRRLARWRLAALFAGGAALLLAGATLGLLLH